MSRIAPIVFGVLCLLVAVVFAPPPFAHASSTGPVAVELSKQAAADLGAAIATRVAELVATTPSAADVTNARGRAITSTEEKHFGQDVSTSTLNVMGNSATTGAPEATWDADVVQMFRITNSHATQAACFMTFPRAAAATTCNTVCAAASMTCRASGAVLTDGSALTSAMPPFTTTITGLDCLCVEANGATTPIEATRISRAPNQ